jgi:hypothetical protein
MVCGTCGMVAKAPGNALRQTNPPQHHKVRITQKHDPQMDIHSCTVTVTTAGSDSLHTRVPPAPNTCAMTPCVPLVALV